MVKECTTLQNIIAGDLIIINSQWEAKPADKQPEETELLGIALENADLDQSVQVLISEPVINSGVTGDCNWFLYNNGSLYIVGPGEMGDYSESNRPTWEEQSIEITDVYFINDVVNIGKYAFWEYTNLEVCQISNKLTKIGDYAFSGCVNLGKRENQPWLIPYTVETVGPYAFNGWTIDQVINIQQTQEYAEEHWPNWDAGCLAQKNYSAEKYPIDSGITGQCTWIKYNDLTLEIIGPGRMGDYSETENNLAPWGTDIQLVSFLDGVTLIGAESFCGCEDLQIDNSTIPESIKFIGEKAFCDCSLSETESLVVSCDVGAYAFANTLLPEITINGGSATTYLGEGAFTNCLNLNNVTLSNTNITRIKQYTFYDCNSLAAISLPSSIQFIDDNAFCFCNSLSIDGLFSNLNLISIGKEAFVQSNLYSSTDLILPNSLISIESKAFSGCDGLISISIPENLQYLGDKVFEDCTNVSEILYNNSYSIPIIGENIFSNCGNSNMEITLTIGPNTVVIPASLFYTTELPPYLSTLQFDDNSQCKSIGINSFKGCVILHEILNVPETLNIIERGAFDNTMWYGLQIAFAKIGTVLYSCKDKEIEELNKNDLIDITSITSEAFIDCDALTSAAIPANVLNIGHGIFNGCTSLEVINCEVAQKPPSWADDWNVGYENITHWEDNPNLL